MLSCLRQGDFSVSVYARKLADLALRFRYGDPAQHIRNICGDAVADECGPIWGLNREGEINGAWRELKVKGLWPMLGVFSRTSELRSTSNLCCRKPRPLSLPFETCWPAYVLLLVSPKDNEFK